MKIEICTKEHMASMIMMPSGSDAQNQALRAALMSEEILLEQCYIMLQNQKVVCRIVIDEKRNYLSSFTVEDIDVEEINYFLDVVFNQLDKTKTWRTDLYTDKIHYQRIYLALHQHFPIRIQRESYVAETRMTDTSSWRFKSAHEMNKEELLQLMMNACHTSLDTMIQREQQELGQRNAILCLMEELLEDEESNTLFQILWINHQPAGFVSVTRLFQDVGGIGFLGVATAFQGQHYSEILLLKALDIAYHHGIHKLIGDIDIKNIHLRDHLITTGFNLDCKQNIFLLPSQSKSSRRE